MDMDVTDNVQRATSSASEEITRIPASLSDFCQLLRSRIAQQSCDSICSKDQEALVKIIISEVCLVWQDLRWFPLDPTLTLKENRCLRCWTFIEVLNIGEQLYIHFLHRLGLLQTAGNLSHEANRCRLAAQLASDFSYLLNVNSIKRSIAAGIKITRKKRIGDVTHLDNILPSLENHLRSKQHKKETQQNLLEIQEKIGDLDEEIINYLSVQLESMTSTVKPIKAVEKDTCISQKYIARLKGCHSMPNLRRQTLLEELNISKPPVRSASTLVLLSTELKKRVNPAEDLRRLVKGTYRVDMPKLTDSEIALPPLIRALNFSGSSELKKLNKLLHRMETKEKKIKKSQVVVLQPEHPQIAVVNVNLSSRSFVRAAESRVTDRTLSETINISLNPPVYNDLTGEIEPSETQRLDQNLQVGTELKKTYQELSQTITTDYFKLDEDPMIEPAMTKLMPCLKRSLDTKLINPLLYMPDLYGKSHRKKIDIVNQKRQKNVTRSQTCKSDLKMNDYLNFVAKQESDYLPAVFHLYDSEEEEDEEEEVEKAKKLLQMKEEEQLKTKEKLKQQEKINALKQEKRAYVPGLWNVNTVLMGGLWNEPVHGEEDQLDVKNHQIEVSVKEEQLQAKLQSIWNMLCLSEAQRLDMAIKYSSDAHRDQLFEATLAWEEVADFIQQRELLLSQLEEFERMASDPKRFFQHGDCGNSKTRMKEASHREKLQSKILALDKLLYKIISYISSTFNDTVTYKGRLYEEKMRWDRIEMLYWLQQERRVEALHKLLKESRTLPTRLPPLNHDLLPSTYPTADQLSPQTRETNISFNKLCLTPIRKQTNAK